MVLLHGYCTQCHKVKRVDVKVPLPGHLNTGVCRECQDRKTQPRKEH